MSSQNFTHQAFFAENQGLQKQFRNQTPQFGKLEPVEAIV